MLRNTRPHGVRCAPFTCRSGPSHASSAVSRAQPITPTNGNQAYRDVFAKGVMQQPANQRVSPRSVKRRQQRCSTPFRILTWSGAASTMRVA